MMSEEQKHKWTPFNNRFITVNTDTVQVYTHSSPQHRPSSVLTFQKKGC